MGKGRKHEAPIENGALYSRNWSKETSYLNITPRRKALNDFLNHSPGVGKGRKYEASGEDRTLFSRK